MPDQGVKATFVLTPDAKFKLAQLKATLRYKGLRATEAGIVEALIGAADADKLARLLREPTEAPRGKAGHPRGRGSRGE